MSFITKILPSKKILIIDIGTYKVKSALCEYKNNEIKVIGYAEKRQEKSDILGTEIANIEGISNTISYTIDKITKKHNINPKDIILNIPTSTVISAGKNINYSRQKDAEIDITELDSIISTIEREALSDAKLKIMQKTGFAGVDMKLITSSITQINIDGFRISNPLGFTGKTINLSVLNIFIPESRYKILQVITSYLNKNLFSIIPGEFALPKILSYSDYAYDDVLFIDIGNTKTSLIIQKNGVIEGFDKVNIGMQDLIKVIKENTLETDIQIIKNLSNNVYQEEKKEFLSVWQEAFIIAIKEFYNSPLIPHKILLTGGGDLDFIKNHIKQIPLGNYSLHTLRPFVFIEDLNLGEITKIQAEKDFLTKENISLLSMILTAKEIIQYQNNPVLSLVKNFLEKNEL